MEKLIETTMYRSRWLLAPIYLGLSVTLIVLAFKFFQEAYHLILTVYGMTEADMILIVLGLIDISMVGGLIVMVMMSGYENFVSRINVADGEETLAWLGQMDTSSLKAKIAASIVAISSIHLLKAFMAVTTTENDKLMWYVLIHMTFVLSAFVMGYLDILNKKSK